jgi:hypothetical protein
LEKESCFRFLGTKTHATAELNIYLCQHQPTLMISVFLINDEIKISISGNF